MAAATNGNPFDGDDSVCDEESPETNYFKMMMQDNEAGRIAARDRDDDGDDSVLGGATLASMMGSSDKKKKTSSKGAAAAKGSYTVPHRDPSPAETLSIVGVEDDVSTIANDTVNETTKAFFNNHGTKEASQPRIRLFKEYKTPIKSKKKSEGSTEDDETAPETPPGMIRVPGRSSSEGGEESAREPKQKKKSSKSPMVRSKRVYIVAGVLAVILFASIIALAVALSGMKDRKSSAPVTPVEADEDILDSWPDLDTEDLATPSVSPPLGEGESMAPSAATTEGGTGGGTVLTPSTPAPTFSATTVGPTTDPLDSGAAFDELYSLLVGGGIVPEDIEDSPTSPQYQAMVWLSNDPNFFNYLEQRMLQRWSLAVVANSMDATGTQARGRKLLEGWLQYTNECTWFTSGKMAVCDDRGNFERLNIQELQLGGTLPSEIALLSNSLRYINLDGNNLQGPIPSSLGQLTLLESLSMRRNSFNGPLVTEIGLLSSLQRINLGLNQFSGAIPRAIGNLGLLEILRLDHNDLTGEIPAEIGNLAGTLTSLALNDNFLNGKIPNEIVNLDSLEALYIGNNDLTGELPKNMCKIRDLEIISLDCEAQGCQCCTECADEDTVSPTAAKTQTPSLPLTTVAPTTSGPTSCADAIAALDTCVSPGAAVDLVFNNCEPQNDDWVGIYKAEQDFSQLPNPPVWSWACGTRNCREEVSSLEFSLSEEHAASNAWPLEEGEYVLILARNSAQPYTAFATSPAFTIQAGC